MSSSKLKGIYEALDHGNYKNALKLAGGFLQKQPQHALCKALQAVALERCGRRDEALRICGETVAGPGLDETVLSTCQVVYRRCRQNAATVQMYDAAWSREPENEDYALSLFFSVVREGDFAKSQQVAARLFKKFGKPDYLCWIVAVYLLQAEKGAAPQALSLAEMMLKKAPMNFDVLINEKEHAPFHRQQLYLLQLHLTTLRMQKKHAEALTLLESGAGLVRLPADVAGLRLCLLTDSAQHAQAAREARTAAMARPGDWGALRAYVHLAFAAPVPDGATQELSAEAEGERVPIQDHGCRLRPRDGGDMPAVETEEEAAQAGGGDEVWGCLLQLRRLQKAEKGGSVALLAELELRRLAMAQNAAQLPAAKRPNWRAAVSPGDWAVFLGLLKRYWQDCGGRSSCYFELKPFLCLLTAEEGSELLEASTAPTASLWRVRRGFRRAGAGEEALRADLKELLSAWQSVKEADAQGGNELLALAVATLTDLAKLQATPEGRLAACLDALALAELGVAASPQAFQLKVLMVLLYGSLGAHGAMLGLYNRLDIKNIQHESLSYMVLDVLGARGCHDGFREVCNSIAQFHEDMDKDVGDLLGLAFRQGVLHRVPEYLASLNAASGSVLWGRAVLSEVVYDLAQCQTWEQVQECMGRQSTTLALVAGKAPEQWTLANQDRTVLSSLHPLPLATPLAGLQTLEESTGPQPTVKVVAMHPAAFTSSALVWRGAPSASPQQPCSGEQRSALEELLACPDNAAVELRLSAALMEGLGALVAKEEPRLAAAVAAAKAAADAAGATEEPAAAAAAGLPWSAAPAISARKAACLGLASLQLGQLVLQCAAGKEPWEKAEAALAGLGESLKALESSVGGEGLGVGGAGASCVWALLQHGLAVLVPVALWCHGGLPKGGGKKAKEGQEALHAARAGLKELLATLQATCSALSERLAQAEKAAGAEEGGASFAEGLLPEQAEFAKHREKAKTAVCEGHKQHLQALKQALGMRSSLLRSRGPFKP